MKKSDILTSGFFTRISHNFVFLALIQVYSYHAVVFCFVFVSSCLFLCSSLVSPFPAAMFFAGYFSSPFFLMLSLLFCFLRPYSRYQIHYPGWDSNWDEWVSRDRLRWPVDPSYLSTIFMVRDKIEVWCTGTHVKGAWLQARVRQVRFFQRCQHS